jgi:hypothetical protein
VAAGHAEVGEELDDRLGGHGRAPVGVDDELVGVDVLVGEALADEVGRPCAHLSGGDEPTDDVAAEDVAAVTVRPCRRSLSTRTP